MNAPFQAMQSLFAGGHGRLEDKANNFTAIRIGFAFLVVLAHAVILPVGLPYEGPLPGAVDATVQYALDGFFILSGYMIAASLARKPDMLSYATSRALRILPGLAAAALILFLVVGPLFSELSPAAYFTHPDAWRFPGLILFQADPMAELPGVFADHPMTEMNAPLWTIRYELLAYLGAGVIAALGGFRTARTIAPLFLAAAALSVAESVHEWDGIGSGTVFNAARFGGAFMTGAVFYALRDRLPLAPGWIGLAILAAFLLKETPAAMIAGQIAMAWATLWLGYLPLKGVWGRRVREVEDVSYGVYILHWPIGQIALALIPGIAWFGLYAIMVPAALAAGWALRVGVEKPALALKPGVLAALRARLPRPRLAGA